MNVSLTPALEKFVRERVESGLYGNASEVIREALRLMIQRDGGAPQQPPPSPSGPLEPMEPADKPSHHEDTRAALLALEPALRERGVESAALFGAAARGDDQPGSRVDILVEFSAGEDPPLGDQIALATFLEQRLGRRVDMMTRDGLDPVIRDVVLKGARKIF